jgi:hypothetical protein
MVSAIIRLVRDGVKALRDHPQFLLIVLILFIIPGLFLYSGQQFLDAGRENQDRLQKDKIGILHDVFASFIVATNFDVEVMQAEIDRISSVNNDIIDFRIVTIEKGVVAPVAALDRSKIGQLETPSDMFKNASIRTDESLIF